MNERLLKRVQYKFPNLDLSKYSHDELYELDEMTPTPREYWEEVSNNREENNNEED